MRAFAPFASLLILAGLAQPAPVTIEVTRDVRATEHAGPSEERGTLYLQDAHAPSFWMRKGQRFQMLKAGSEGSCQIEFQGRKYRLTSCPWLPGFRDHQSDIFRKVDGTT